MASGAAIFAISYPRSLSAIMHLPCCFYVHIPSAIFDILHFCSPFPPFTRLPCCFFKFMHHLLSPSSYNPFSTASMPCTLLPNFTYPMITLTRYYIRRFSFFPHSFLLFLFLEPLDYYFCLRFLLTFVY